MPTFDRILRYTIVLFAIAALGESIYGCTASAQALPDAPSPRILSPDHIAIAYDGMARILDVVSTNQFLGRGGHEDILPTAVVDHPALMVGFEAAVMGAEWFGARELRKHGHPKLARMVWMIDGSAVLATDISNFEIQRAPVIPSAAPTVVLTQAGLDPIITKKRK